MDPEPRKGMLPKPPRPEPTEKILDYDDGDPYSCIAAGNAEEELQRALQRQVDACYGAPPEELEALARQDIASVRTALYDVWDGARTAPSTRAKARWAAERLADLGLPDVLRYDQQSRTGPG